MPWRQRRSSLPSKRTGSPCTCAMGIWISTMCSWEAVTQPSSEYNRMHLGIQISDLYRFMRKVMEKHGWNLDLGLSMLDSYERVLPMEPKERGCLYYLFLYPENTGSS